MMKRVSRRYGLGMTIVELLVAMVIGLFMLGATYSMFLAYQRAYSDTERTSRMAENGRFALHLITSDVRMAGFLGEAPARDIALDPELGAVANDCANPGGAYDVVNYLAVLESDAGGDAMGCIDDAVPGTGVLIVKSVLPVRVAAADVSPNNVYVVTNRLRGIIFRGDDASPPSIVTGGDVPDGEYWEYRFVAYYIRDGAVPRLSRKILRFNGAQQSVLTEDLVDGVDDLRAMVGLDSDGDGRVDRTVAPDAVDDWTEAAHLQIFVLVRSTEAERGYVDQKSYQLGDVAVGPLNDEFKRTVIEGSAALRNKAW